MQTSQTFEELKSSQCNWPRPVAFVPTMGALHPGHMSLIEQARAIAGANGTVVTSIFVNPLQFDRTSDLEQYPRTLEDDLTLCKEYGVDHVFHPTASQFYEDNHSIQVLESSLSKHLCGATRTGHFDGVCTVVLKLFNLIKADYAIFGKKDYQQLAIIKRLVRDLSHSTEIIGAETLRDTDGLAMSSRNRNLSPADRADAPRLRRALLAAQSLCATGEQNPQRYLNTAKQQLLSPTPSESFRIDYLELVSRETLQPLSLVTQPALLAIAVFYDNVRLIDNIELDPS